MKIANIRIGKEIELAAKRVQKKCGLSQSDIFRMAIEQGLPAVEKALSGILAGEKSASAK